MTTNDVRAANLAAWIELFTGLPDADPPPPKHLATIAAGDVLFKDPFNETRGHEALIRLLAHTRDQVKRVRFTILATAWTAEAAYLKWEMSGRVKYIGPWLVKGISEITFDERGRVKAHVDYWDAASQLYARLPVVGGLFRWLLRKGAA